MTNDDTTGTVTVESVGNTRNAGCKAVEISGDVSASIDGCSGSYDFKIPDHDLNTGEYTIKAGGGRQGENDQRRFDRAFHTEIRGEGARIGQRQGA